MTTRPMLPLIAPTNVAANPTPTDFAVAELRAGAQRWIALQTATIVGVHLYFLEPDHATNLGRMLQQTASGIVLVGANEAPPPPRVG